MFDEIPIVVSSCDLYKDAWNPFFRLLEANWENCPRNIYLITEKEVYSDGYFNVNTILHDTPVWSDRMICALKKIDAEYIWFFLEDFFLEEPVNEEIIKSAVECIKNNNQIGVIKFIPHITSNWYDENKNYGKYFSLIPSDYKARSNLMLALYKKDYLLKMLRKKETPWDFERFGTYRSRRYREKVLIQNDQYPLAFTYNYQIKYGYGISSKKWLKNNKQLFERYNISVNFENLGWYNEKEKVKIIGLKRSKKEKILLPVKDPRMFLKIIKTIATNQIYCLKHIRHYF